MPQIVTDEKGVRHSFPDEATPEMIAKVLGAKVGTGKAAAAAPAKPTTLDERAKEVFGFEDYPKRGTILPVAETKEGETKVAWPQIIVDMAKSFLLPGHAVQGGAYTPKDVTEFAVNFAVPGTMKKAPTGPAAIAESRGEFLRKAPSTESLRAKGSAGFAQAEATGVILKPDKFMDTLADIETTLAKEGIDKMLHSKATAVMQAMAKRIGEGITVQDLQIMRRQMGIAARSIAPELADERRIAMIMQEKLDDMIDNLKPGDVDAGDPAKLGPALAEARATWAKAMKVDRIETAIENAKLSKGGFETGLRDEFRKIIKSDKLSRGFSKQELAAIRAVWKSGFTASTLRLIGRVGFGRGGFSNILAMLGGGAAGLHLLGPAGAIAVPVVGQAAKLGVEQLTARKAALARAAAATGRKVPASFRRQATAGLLRRSGGFGVGGLVSGGQSE